MRLFARLFMIASLACWDATACLAQQVAGPATSNGLRNSDADPKRTAGPLARPNDGVQHPDLDKAWAEYDAVVAKAGEGIKAAITKQFDAATAKGDLDAAEKWQSSLEKFEKAGEVPSEGEAKAAVSAAVADYKRAKEELSKAYEFVVKALTMEKKIEEAKLARDELRAVRQAAESITKMPRQPVERTGNDQNGRPKVTKPVAKNRAYSHYRLVATKSNANGWEAYYRTIEFFDVATGKPLTGGKATGIGTGATDAFDDDRATSYRTVMNPGVEGDWIAYELPKAALVNRVRVVQWGGDGNHVFWFEVQGSNDGDNWTPLMNARSVPDVFDSASPLAQVEWYSQ